jgi:uncharacterized membrane protein
MIQLKYILSAIVLVLLDSVYLNMITKYFNNQIKKVQQTDIEIKLSGVIMCYVFLIFGLNYFIIQYNKSPLDAFLLGLTIYAVYELTNYALLKKWSVKTVVLDTLWGGILFGLTTIIVYKITTFRFIKKLQM